MFDITTIIEAVIALVVAIITAVVVPFIRSKTTERQRENINGWVKLAVEAAEQLYKGSGRGAEKKAYVITWLESFGVTVDDERIDLLIEAAVYELTAGKGGVASD